MISTTSLIKLFLSHFLEPSVDILDNNDEESLYMELYNLKMF